MGNVVEKGNALLHMKLLAIDTSTSRASVALTVDGVMYSEHEDDVTEHARCLLPMIERLMRSVDVRLSQLDGLVFGRGPGSFTGLRIACSVAKGLAYAHNVPVYPVSGLAAIAYDVYYNDSNLAPDTSVLAMIDARMHQVYWALYDQKGGGLLEHVTPASDVMIDSLAPVVIAGVGLNDYFAELPVAVHAHRVSERVVYPEASALIGLVQAGRVVPVTAALAAPVYVRNQVTQGVPRG